MDILKRINAYKPTIADETSKETDVVTNAIGPDWGFFFGDGFVLVFDNAVEVEEAETVEVMA